MDGDDCKTCRALEPDCCKVHFAAYSAAFLTVSEAAVSKKLTPQSAGIAGALVVNRRPNPQKNTLYFWRQLLNDVHLCVKASEQVAVRCKGAETLGLEFTSAKYCHNYNAITR